MSDLISGPLNAIRNSKLLRVMLIGFLVLLLQIPIFMIENLIGDRTARRAEAVKDVTGKWGEEQTVMGPVLAVPYIVRWTEEEEKSGKKIVHTIVRSASF